MPFIKIEKKSTCQSIEHNPPDWYNYEPETKYVYKCPDCGEETTIIIS